MENPDPDKVYRVVKVTTEAPPEGGLTFLVECAPVGGGRAYSLAVPYKDFGQLRRIDREGHVDGKRGDFARIADTHMVRTATLPCGGIRLTLTGLGLSVIDAILDHAGPLPKVDARQRRDLRNALRLILGLADDWAIRASDWEAHGIFREEVEALLEFLKGT